jgi:hypothetical protein
MILVQSVALFFQKRFHKCEVGFLSELGEKLKDGERRMHQSMRPTSRSVQSHFSLTFLSFRAPLGASLQNLKARLGGRSFNASIPLENCCPVHRLRLACVAMGWKTIPME